MMFKNPHTRCNVCLKTLTAESHYRVYSHTKKAQEKRSWCFKVCSKCMNNIFSHTLRQHSQNQINDVVCRFCHKGVTSEDYGKIVICYFQKAKQLEPGINTHHKRIVLMCYKCFCEFGGEDAINHLEKQYKKNFGQKQ